MRTFFDFFAYIGLIRASLSLSIIHSFPIIHWTSNRAHFLRHNRNWKSHFTHSQSYPILQALSDGSPAVQHTSQVKTHVRGTMTGEHTTDQNKFAGSVTHSIQLVFIRNETSLQRFSDIRDRNSS